MADYIDWPGQKGTYRYWFLEKPSDGNSIKPEAGNYMFVRPTNQGWVPVYIGIASDLSSRIPYHEQAGPASVLGATKVMAHTQSSESIRNAEEADLISHWQPELNIQLRRPKTILGG